MTLREWIRKERREGRHWTLERIAREVGRAPSNLSRAVNGRVIANVELAQRVEDLTNGEVGLRDWPTKPVNNQVKDKP